MNIYPRSKKLVLILLQLLIGSIFIQNCGGNNSRLTNSWKTIFANQSIIYSFNDSKIILTSKSNEAYKVHIERKKITGTSNLIKPVSPLYSIEIEPLKYTKGASKIATFQVSLILNKKMINNRATKILNDILVFNENSTIATPINYTFNSKENSYNFIISSKENNKINFFLAQNAIDSLFEPYCNNDVCISPYGLNYPIIEKQPIKLTFNKPIPNNIIQNIKNIEIFIDTKKVYNGILKTSFNLPGTTSGLHILSIVFNTKHPILKNFFVDKILSSTTFFLVQKNNNFQLNEYKELLYRYSPILELGNIKTVSYLQDKLKDWYGLYKEELYIPICLEDLPIYTQGYMTLNTASVDNLPFWLNKNDNYKLLFGVVYNYKFYPTKLKYLWEFPSVATGLCFNKNEFKKILTTFLYNLLSIKYVPLKSYFYYVEYTSNNSKLFSPFTFPNGAQFLVKSILKGSCIYANVKADKDFIYLQYWFYYPYDPKTPNKVTAKLFAQHIGDNEFLEVVLDKKSLKPLWVFFAHHNDDQKFAYLDPNTGKPLFIWNDLGFGTSQGIGGCIVSWEKVHKVNTHPIAYVALGSHGLYPRKGFYAVDDPHLDFNSNNFNIDLFEFAGNGEHLIYNRQEFNSIEAIDNIIGLNTNTKFLLSPLSSYGENIFKACIQRDVRFFPYSSFYLNLNKTKCFIKLPDNSQNYDYKFNNIKLKVANNYCRSIIVDNNLFPDKGIFKKLDKKIDGSYVTISGILDLNNRKSLEFLGFLKDETFKLLINWDYPNSTEWDLITSDTISSLEDYPFEASHTYDNPSKNEYTIALRFVVKGAYVDKYIKIQLSNNNNNNCSKVSYKIFFEWLNNTSTVTISPFFNISSIADCKVIDLIWSEDEDYIVYMNCTDINNGSNYTLRLSHLVDPQLIRIMGIGDYDFMNVEKCYSNVGFEFFKLSNNNTEIFFEPGY